MLSSGAACEAAIEGIPSIAFSGDGGCQVSYTTLSAPSASMTTANVFAALGVKFTDALLSSGVSASDPHPPSQHHAQRQLRRRNGLVHGRRQLRVRVESDQRHGGRCPGGCGDVWGDEAAEGDERCSEEWVLCECECDECDDEG